MRRSATQFARLARPAAAVAAAVTAMGVCASTALAGTNGQHIYFTTTGQACGPVTGVVTVTGTNQNGQPAVWSGVSADGHSVFTAGWWWKGPVTIRFAGHTVVASVPQAHDITDGPAGDQVTVTCNGTRYFPTYYRFANLGGKVYYLLNNTVAFDPLFRKYVSRLYTFGYWDGHYVYKITNQVGVDINTAKIVIAQTTNHWVILGGAVAGARACNPPGVNWTGYPWARAVVTSWCGAGGAIGAYLR